MRIAHLFALVAIFLALAPWGAHAQQAAGVGGLAAGVTEEEVAVGTDYRGARFVVFGAVFTGGRGRNDLVIVLRGPGEDENVVRRKKRILGFWINSDPVTFRDAPSFFAIASSRPIGDFLSPIAISEHGLDPGALARIEGRTPQDSDPGAYRRAFVRLKREAGLYRESPRGLAFDEDGSYKAPFIIPSNAPIGKYEVDVYLFRNSRLIRHRSSEVIVNRIGIERTIYTAAQEQPLVYGLATALFALLAGWAAAFVFRRN